MKLIDLFEQQVVIQGDIVILKNITTLVGYKHKGKPIAGAKVLGNFNCYLTNISSLEGGPSYVGGDFICANTEIKSLHNIHKQIKHIGGAFSISNTVKSHILGVMFIKGLQKIEFYDGNTEQKQVENIINKHLAGNRNIHLAQEELLEAGLKEYAKL